MDGSQWAAASPASDDSIGDDEAEESDENVANRRHVWVVENDLLKAIEVEIGFMESRLTTVTSGELKPGMALVTGLQK